MPPTRPASSSTATTTPATTTTTSTTTEGTVAVAAPRAASSSSSQAAPTRQPISGAHIHLLAADTSGWGKASVSLINPSASGVSSDADGAYVTSSSTGGFSLTNRYTCTPGQQVYVYATGGNPGRSDITSNPAIAMMAVFGTCPAAGTFAGAISSFTMSEVTTVATIYALAGFMTDPTHVSSGGSDNALAGLANAFGNYNNLVDLGTGEAKAFNDQGNGFIPQAKINALANVIAPCNGSNGAGAACSNLFSAARSSAVTSAPATTAAAMLAIAHSPSLNVAQRFALASANPPYLPTLSAAPQDWTIGLTFFSDNMPGPYYLAVDAKGNIWVPGYASDNINKFDPRGNFVYGWGGGGIKQPFAVAIDSSGNPWVVNYYPGASTVSRLLSDGTPVSATALTCADRCLFPAFDASGNLWVSGTTQTTVFDASGSKKASYAIDAATSGIAVSVSGSAWTLGKSGLLARMTLPNSSTRFTQTVSAADADVTPTAIDASGNLWFTSGINSRLGKIDPNGGPLSPGTGYTGGGLSSPAGVAIDGAGRVWVANRGNSSVSEFSNSGDVLSPDSGLGTDKFDSNGVTAGISGPRGIAVDPSGNVWVSNFTYNSVTELMGAATPTATPLMPGNHGALP